MSQPGEEDVLATGLRRFYSSQAEVMLAQYGNINNLLGPTHHHTHPGTHCEILLRNCIRAFLPPTWSADKGYIFGRVTRDGQNVHSPEIDILIHDAQASRPVFRLEDFVIVQPKAVVGMIQVKKSLEGAQVTEGVDNVINAKQHLLDLMRSQNRGRIFVDRFPFSGVVGFEGSLSQGRLGDHLNRRRDECKQHEKPEDGLLRTSSLVLPDFVGSLSGAVAVSNRGMPKTDYYVFDAVVGDINIAIQLLYWKISHIIPLFHASTDQVPLPSDLRHSSTFSVGSVNEQAGDSRVR
jgi:hypothetical protein